MNISVQLMISFHVSGYKINRIKTPNITGRLNFNYVEIGQNEEIGFR